MLEKYPEQVKLVIKHFPLTRHKYAVKAAQAALSAGRQGKFSEFHRSLFENYKNLNDAKIDEIANKLALNMEKFKKTMQSPSIRNLINRDVKDGKKVGVRGTPTIFINGKLLKNKNSRSIYQMIDAELKKK